jgi:hypothetical protein
MTAARRFRTEPYRPVATVSSGSSPQEPLAFPFLSDASLRATPIFHRPLPTWAAKWTKLSGRCSLPDSAHSLMCRSDPPHIRPSTELLCLLPSILTTPPYRNPCPDLRPSEITHAHRQTPLQVRRHSGSQRRHPMSPTPPPPIVPLSISREPSSSGGPSTDGSGQEIGDGGGATSQSLWRSIPPPRAELSDESQRVVGAHNPCSGPFWDSLGPHLMSHASRPDVRGGQRRKGPARPFPQSHRQAHQQTARLTLASPEEDLLTLTPPLPRTN